VRRVLLCPLNVTLALPSEISGESRFVEREIEGYLGKHGLEVQKLGLSETRGRWQRAAAEAKHTGSKDAGEIFVKDLRGSREFDAVVLPSLILRSVSVTDSSGTWDGVRRMVSMVNLPHRGQGGEAGTLSKGIALGGISGAVMAASLHVMAYLADGQRVFEGIGGLDFVQEADLGGASRSSWELRMSPSRLRRPAVLSEGVEIAFGPFLPPPDDP
jgi:hypothetical protein